MNYKNYIFYWSPGVYVAFVFYLGVAYLLLRKWLFFFLEDKEMTDSQRSISRVILGIATMFWPIILPFAYLELLNLHIKYRKEIDLSINATDIQVEDDE